jgi:hypothetical protein
MGSCRPAPGQDIAIEDCADLLRAVATRLRAIADTDPGLPCEPGSVLECVMALDQLHKTMAHEFEIAQRVKLKARTRYAFSGERACA